MTETGSFGHVVGVGGDEIIGRGNSGKLVFDPCNKFLSNYGAIPIL